MTLSQFFFSFNWEEENEEKNEREEEEEVENAIFVNIDRMQNTAQRMEHRHWKKYIYRQKTEEEKKEKNTQSTNDFENM